MIRFSDTDVVRALGAVRLSVVGALGAVRLSVVGALVAISLLFFGAFGTVLVGVLSGICSGFQVMGASDTGASGRDSRKHQSTRDEGTVHCFIESGCYEFVYSQVCYVLYGS